MSNQKIFSSALTHPFWGIFWSVFSKFALQKGQIFGADAPSLRVEFQILKSHTHIQKSGKNSPLGLFGASAGGQRSIWEVSRPCGTSQENLYRGAYVTKPDCTFQGQLSHPHWLKTIIIVFCENFVSCKWYSHEQCSWFKKLTSTNLV